MNEANILKSYELAKERYAALGVDTDKALETLKNTPISLHCWQTDDVIGFETPDGVLSGGIQTTGNYPGRARNIDEVRQDIQKPPFHQHLVQLPLLQQSFPSIFFTQYKRS